MTSKGGPNTIYDILMCDTQLEMTYGNDQMRIWKKKLRNLHSVNTNIERKMMAIES